MSTEEVRQHFIEAGPVKHFFNANVVDRALEDETERRAQPPATPYTLDQECTMLTAFARRVVDVLDKRAIGVRSHHVLRFDEGQVDWFPEAVQSDRTQAEVCRLLGSMGTSAQVRPAQREQLEAKGLSDDEIGMIDVTARRHAKAEDRRNWLIGPNRDVLLHHLDAVGIAPTDQHVRRLRASALWMMADLLELMADRYVVVPKHVTDIAAKVFHESRVPSAGHRTQPAVVWNSPAPRSADSLTPRAEQEAQGLRVPAADARPPGSFVAFVTKLARSKSSLKVRSWTEKTANQHISIAKMFSKVALTDDPQKMTQAHVGAYISLLAGLPTNWGKSSADAERSIDEIMARVEDLDDQKIGLAAPTINRHRTQLSTILAHLEENGYAIGVVSAKSVARDPEAPDEKRGTFTAEEGRMLIAGAPWTIRDAAGTPSYPSLKADNSQYWVFLICWYMLTRLGEACGLMVVDIDLAGMMIAIRTNKLRRVKNPTSKRTIPIPFELLRIGFVDFVLQQRALGHEALFPELHNSATASTVLFYKKWVQVLDQALPDARLQRKTMHSTRKGGNGAMIEGKVIDSVRYYILGHAPKDAHGKHYTSAPTREAMLEAFRDIPVITRLILSVMAGDDTGICS